MNSSYADYEAELVLRFGPEPDWEDLDPDWEYDDAWPLLWQLRARTYLILDFTDNRLETTVLMNGDLSAPYVSIKEKGGRKSHVVRLPGVRNGDVETFRASCLLALDMLLMGVETAAELWPDAPQAFSVAAYDTESHKLFFPYAYADRHRSRRIATDDLKSLREAKDRDPTFLPEVDSLFVVGVVPLSDDFPFASVCPHCGDISEND